MTSARIKTLLGPPHTSDSHKRTLDILNAKYKTLQDLQDEDDLESIVEQARIRRDDLHAKLSQSQADVDTLIAQTRGSIESNIHTAQELSLLRHSLVDELSFLSQELVSSLSDGEREPTLLEDIETMHRSLKELESVKGYVQIIEHALKLSESAVQQIRDSTSLASLSEYEALQRFVSSVSGVCTKVEEVAGQQELHIVTFLGNVRDKTWQDIKGVLSTALLNAADKLHWPMQIDYTAASSEDRRAFESAFFNLLKLQSIGKTLHPSPATSHSEKGGLYPIQTLVQPVSLRFKYHFEGTRQTNRLDKPEWYFTHVLNVSHEHRPFLETVIQNLLSGTEYREIIAWREFTLSLLPLLERKLRRTIPSLLTHPPVLAHTIYQALVFDAALKEDGFGVVGTSASKRPGNGITSTDEEESWAGISDVILGRKEWFETWMEGERNFAMDQYMGIISSPDAWLIADDDTDEDENLVSEYRPTVSARRVKALVEQVTDRYSPLPQFTHRTRFLIAVQLPLLESYHSRISSSLDAFETLSSSFMRAVPGALSGDGAGGDTRRLTSGVDGLQRLCKALVSARYISAVMDTWGEELFFLELWAEINHKASLRSRAEEAVSLPDPKVGDDTALEGTIFEELVTQYNKLAERTEDMIVQAACNEVEAGLKVYFNSGNYVQDTPQHSPSGDDISLSPALLAPIALLSSYLSFLQSTLPQAAVTGLYRRIASQLAAFILNRAILYRGRARISAPDGKIMLAECELWVETCRIALGRMEMTRVEAPWRTLLQATRLIVLEGDAWRKVIATTFGTEDEVQWEEVMLTTVGLAEMGREEVAQLLRVRNDCGR